jgi:guanine deaminase
VDAGRIDVRFELARAVVRVYWFENALCLVEECGLISARRCSIETQGACIRALHAPGTRPPEECEFVDATALLATPGLVNCHTHSPDNLTRGTTPDLPLELWSLTSSATREGRTAREIHVSTMLGAIEMMHYGTTAVLDHIRISPDINLDALDAVASAWLASGMRVVIAPIVADKAVIETLPFESDELRDLDLSAYGGRKPMPPAEQIAVVEAFYRKWHGAYGGRISVAIGPSGPQRCSDDLLVQAADFSQRYGTLLHTHVLETRLQQEMGRQLNPAGMISHMGSLGLLSERTNLVHSIWLEQGDVERIAEAGATIVHNPVSNARLGSGFCPLPLLLDKGIRVGLGTDSAACNDSGNLLETMKWATILHNLVDGDEKGWVGPQRALKLATSGGADVIGLRETGCLRAGMSADITFFRLSSPAFAPLNNPVRQLVLSETGSGIERVVIAGETVVRDGRSTKIDEAAIWAEAAAFADRNRRNGHAALAATHVLDAPIRKMRQRYSAQWGGGCSCH